MGLSGARPARRKPGPVLRSTIAAARPMLGWVIVAGVFGLLLAARIALKNLTERTNATIRFDGTHLLWGQQRVAVGDVTSYSTYSRRMVFASQPGLQFGRARERFASSTGFALFRRADGTVTTFMWPSMTAEQVDGARAALDPLLPGRWQPHTES